MDAYESALLNALNNQVTILRKIILDNRLHESDCPAFTNAKGDFANLFQSLGEKYCDCWISRNNPETDPNKGFGIYERSTETLHQEFFSSRATAVDFLTEEYGFSRDRNHQNYWQTKFYVVESTKEQAAPPPARFEVDPKSFEADEFLPTNISFPTRNEAIAFITGPDTPFVENPMADSYYGHHFNIIEQTEQKDN